MAAQQESTAVQSEDEDSNVELDIDAQFPTIDTWDYTFSKQDAQVLTQDDWAQRDPTGWAHYIPTWTRPGYDDDIEVNTDGTRERPRRGDSWSRMRPAILPTDPPASQYAQRFGIFPLPALDPTAEARSMLTPTGATAEWGFEQGFQSFVFGDLTSQELRDSGAFDPNQSVDTPDLRGDIYQENWTQVPLPPDSALSVTTRARFDCWYNLNGQDKQYDVQRNDELWDALQPALQLASKVLLNEHPYWKAILSFYHTRPVAVERDGRTREQKAEPEYRPYVSLWLDIDRDKMYDSARSLMDRNFDSTAATLEVLRRKLKWSIFSVDHEAGATTTTFFDSNTSNWEIRIAINAVYLWPLLVPQYSASEKVAASVYVAKLCLHELAHAARFASQYLLEVPDGLMDPPWTPPPGTCYDDGVRDDLRALRTEAYQVPYEEYLFQDDPQAEEGKSFEKQIWGFDIEAEPEAAIDRDNDAYRPFLSAVNWPWMHPTVHFQNQRSVEAGNYGNATSHGYRLYLLDPPAPAFDLKTPLPVSSYAKFMQESWWETEFVKFGHQGLRLSIHSTDPSSPMMSVIRPNQTVVEFFPLLTSDLTSTSTQGFNAIWNGVLEALQQPLSDATAGRVSDLTETMRGLLRNLMELNRLLGIEVQYSQGLTAQYVLHSTAARVKIHRRYMQPLQQHLQQMRDSISALLDRVAPSHIQNDQPVWETINAPWETRFLFEIQRNPGVLNGAVQLQTNQDIIAFARVRSQTAEMCYDLGVTLNHLENVVPILDAQYIRTGFVHAPIDYFPGVPLARKKMALSKSVERAAIWEIIRINNASLFNLIIQWMNVLQDHVGLASVFQARIPIMQARLRSDLSVFVSLLFEIKLGQYQPSPAAPNVSREQRLAEMRTTIRNTVGDNNDLRTWLRGLCQARNDEAEFNSIMGLTTA
ncbi:hypothetical protein J7T55_007625 [Diaporthe amygdali]|uniref:uncharacterized protein n=1 Tax=Phomopsis amygdali TaxID=1214568 RepID=UPI0022FF1671|nr:uncharacterized protein J7T55_007625 [Diaporthe amygdali]KAJ0107255.1 hypothetical protein J7T55_007625 [Diaporthe amygdali]